MTGKLRVAQVSAANANADISFIAHCVLSRVKGSKIDTSVKKEFGSYYQSCHCSIDRERKCAAAATAAVSQNMHFLL